MNKENMLELADFLETIDGEQFNMYHWLLVNRLLDNPSKEFNPYDCNTVGCIAGWAALLENNLKLTNLETSDVSVIAKNWLGLTAIEAYNLFHTPKNSVWYFYLDDINCDYSYNDIEEGYEDISNLDAAYVIRKVANKEIDINLEFDESQIKIQLEDAGYYQDEEFY